MNERREFRAPPSTMSVDGVAYPNAQSQRQLGDTSDAVMLIVSWDQAMVRDDDLLRKLLFEIEAYPDPIFPYGIDSGSSDEERRYYYHLQLLADAGLLQESGRYGGAFRMTNAGHDFLATVRNDDAWASVRKAASKLGGISVRMMGEIAYALAKDQAKAWLGRQGIPLD